MLHENRLIGLTQKQLDAQRKAAGLTPISTAKPTAVVAPMTVKTVAPTGDGLVDSTQNVRMSAADANYALQVQNRDASTLGTRATATMQDTGYTGAFSTLADAQKAQQDYYIKTGGSNPEIDAAVYNLQNRQFGVPSPTPGPTGANGSSTELDYASPYSAPSTTPEATPSLQDNAAARGAARINDVEQAQYILSTSRDPNARRSAQEFIDSQVSGVKGYVTKTVTQDNGSTIQTKSIDENATAEAQQKYKESLVQQEANRLKSQEMAEQHKKFVSTIDTTSIDQTTKQVSDLMSRVSTLTPDLQAIILPQLLDLQQSNNDITKQVNEIVKQQPTDAEIESGYGTMEQYIIDQGDKYEAILEKNKQLALDTANYNKEALEIEKKMIEHDAAVAEQKQIAMNVDNEKRLRRQLNRLGLQTDTSSLDYLQSEIQKGATALEDLKTSNNLVSLKAQLAIGKGYTIERDRALNDYEAKYLDITSQVTEKLNTIQNSISTAKKDRNAAIIEAKKWGLEQKQENDKEARTMLSNAYSDMLKAKSEQNKAAMDAQVKDKDVQGFTSSIRSEIQSNAVIKNSRLVDSQYGNITVAMDRYRQIQADIDNGKLSVAEGDVNLSSADQTLISAFNKILDPSSVVREAEYNRTGEDLSLINRAWGLLERVQKGGPGLTNVERNEIYTIATRANQNYQKSLQEQLEPLYMSIDRFNRQEGLTEKVSYAEVLPVSEIHLRPQDFDDLDSIYNSDSGSEGDSGFGGEAITGEYSGFLQTLADAHIKHEGFGSPQAVSITKNNNPGALRWAGGQKDFGGVPPKGVKPDGSTNDTGFTWFPDVASGRKALLADLNAKISGGSSHIDYSKNPTILDYISVYAPVGDRNNPSAYAKSVVEDLNKAGYKVSANTKLSDLKGMNSSGTSVASADNSNGFSVTPTASAAEYTSEPTPIEPAKDVSISAIPAAIAKPEKNGLIYENDPEYVKTAIREIVSDTSRNDAEKYEIIKNLRLAVANEGAPAMERLGRTLGYKFASQIRGMANLTRDTAKLGYNLTEPIFEGFFSGF